MTKPPSMHDTDLIRLLLAEPWAPLAGARKGPGLDLGWEGRLDALVAVTGTALDGTWTPLAAHLAQALLGNDLNRLGTKRGVNAFALRQAPEGVREVRREGHGALQGARNVDWRPGVSHNGLLALALLAKAYTPDQGERRDAPEHRVADNRTDLAGLEAEADWLAIVRLEAFCRAHREAAVRFTEVAMETPHPRVAGSLAFAWGAALTRLPTWLEDAPDLGARLVRALHAGGQGISPLLSQSSTRPPYRRLHASNQGLRDIGLVLYALGRPLGLVPLETVARRDREALGPVDVVAMDPGQRRLAAEMAMALENPHWLSAFAEAADQGMVEASTLARFGAWQDSLDRSEFLDARVWAPLARLALEGRLKPSPPARTGPRL